MADSLGTDTVEQELRLPRGWKLKRIEGMGGSRSKRIVYYESPTGFLYRTPHSVLSHMRTSGLYTQDQVLEFEQEVAKLGEAKDVKKQGGVKRNSDEMTKEVDDIKPKKTRSTDLLASQSNASEMTSIKVENVENDENLKPCKIEIPRLTRQEIQNSGRESKVKAKSVKTEGLKLEDMNLRFKNFVEVFDDKFIPEGWKVIDIPHFMPQNEGTMVTMRRYVSPKGISYNRSMACGFLEKQNDLVNFDTMKRGLLADGWCMNDQYPIPDRFYFQRRSGTFGLQFITPEWKIIKGMKKYKEYLEKNNYDKKYVDVENIKLISLRKESTEKDNLTMNTNVLVDPEVKCSIKEEKGDESPAPPGNYLSEDTDSFPAGWKVTSVGGEILVSNPKGRKFPSRRHALEFMLRSGEDSATLLKVWNTLSKEGWLEGDLLPVGWRVLSSYGVTKFLTRDMAVLVSESEVIDHLKSDKSYSDNDLNNFLIWTGKKSQKNDSPTAEFWCSDQDLPKGWKKSESNPSKYMDASGKIFENKISALKHLIFAHHKPEEIYSLWNTLGDDGWKVDKSLPTGWRRKIINSVDNFLSPMMQVFTSWNHLAEFMESSEELSSSEISKLKQFSCDQKTRSI